jgi:hypothetical protein
LADFLKRRGVILGKKCTKVAMIQKLEEYDLQDVNAVEEGGFEDENGNDRGAGDVVMDGA